MQGEEEAGQLACGCARPASSAVLTRSTSAFLENSCVGFTPPRSGSGRWQQRTTSRRALSGCPSLRMTCWQ